MYFMIVTTLILTQSSPEGEVGSSFANPQSRAVWIGNLGSVTESQIREIAGTYGAVESIKLLPNRM